MARPTYTIISLLLVLLIVYLFVTAPVPLEESVSAQQVEISKVLEIVNDINGHVRNLYTKHIVGAGKKQGLKFDEDWHDEDVHAGPLPAQFLRETAKNLEKSSLQLGLYLGSDFPINTANLFSGKQKDYFQELKQTGKPRFFYVEDIQRYGYMFADKAIADPCVKCHNKHVNSPKTDWKRGDIMGATTWTYPDKRVSFETTLEIIRVLRSSVKNSYAAYIKKTRQFRQPPLLSDRWPEHGYYLPSVEKFMQEVDKRIATTTIKSLMSLTESKTELNAKVGE